LRPPHRPSLYFVPLARASIISMAF
jgi:hypothetical protein